MFFKITDLKYATTKFQNHNLVFLTFQLLTKADEKNISTHTKRSYPEFDSLLRIQNYLQYVIMTMIKNQSSSSVYVCCNYHGICSANPELYYLFLI